ncbi:MAG TPA: hypothetical protein VN831_20160 [Bradyrhizobium sp.]|nr:hypothetical protein [Bradyrhizobium sp.]
MTSRLASAQTAELKVSHFLPPNHTFQKTMVAWSDEIEKQSAGRLKLRIYPAGQLGGGPIGNSTRRATASSTSPSACMARRRAAMP